ncbi:disintegrin and metalloproteinase domain-containing protein 2-like [Molossus molossus]|uniref:disintegrin and metalloproteinase domain-containing protein 2-like n=1 Tax=Molossus molossus TaxID=27622 RepID=UPI001746ECDA|nr:disintegrin and metalloproteinase domain-containing protein 2-like [Molossus molossus]
MSRRLLLLRVRGLDCPRSTARSTDAPHASLLPLPSASAGIRSRFQPPSRQANCHYWGWDPGHQAMLRYLFLIVGLIWVQTDRNSELLHVQITVPEKKESQSKDGVESNVSYNIVIDGKIHTVKMMHKAFLSSGFQVYGYNGTGYMKPFEQQIENFCYYQGYIEDYPNSVAILSTCTGLRGLLQFENVTYAIEPLEPSIGFEHVIYQVKHENTGVSLYAEEDMESRDIPYTIQSVQVLKGVSKYIELHIVVEKNLYNYMGSDTAVVTQKMFQLIGLTNAIFTSFNITIVLSSLEFWIDENKIPVTGDVNELLHRFLKWKRSYLVLRPHDMAFLLVYRENSDYVGATFQGKMCNRQYGGSIALHPKALSLESLAVIITQLLSLSMGIVYDDIEKCQCSGAVCIMNPEAIHSSGVKTFSKCSMEDFLHFISKPNSQCLENHPLLDPSYKAAVCGNQIVEEKEECDCGTQEQCAQNPNECCVSGTCKLKAGNNCDKGPCCTSCHFTEKGQLCRSAVDECDLPEYCNGSSASCSDDLYVLDGFQCDENKWICLNGVCNSLKQQCMAIFGKDASEGPPECFQVLNAMTNEYGSCGSDASGYKKCDTKDIMCGKLLCKYTGENALEIRNASTIYTNIQGQICVSLEYAYDHEQSAQMWVKDGTICDTNKFCKNKECVQKDLTYECDAQKCKSHGKCNNKKNCHCEPNYLPPNCETQQDNWPGGSVDSGNYPPNTMHIPYIENAYSHRPTRWPFFLLIPFCIVLCVMIATLVKVYFQRKKWKTEEYTSDEELESKSEPKSSLENSESIVL